MRGTATVLLAMAMTASPVLLSAAAQPIEARSWKAVAVSLPQGGTYEVSLVVTASARPWAAQIVAVDEGGTWRAGAMWLAHDPQGGLYTQDAGFGVLPSGESFSTVNGTTIATLTLSQSPFPVTWRGWIVAWTAGNLETASITFTGDFVQHGSQSGTGTFAASSKDFIGGVKAIARPGTAAGWWGGQADVETSYSVSITDRMFYSWSILNGHEACVSVCLGVADPASASVLEWRTPRGQFVRPGGMADLDAWDLNGPPGTYEFIVHGRVDAGGRTPSCLQSCEVNAASSDSSLLVGADVRFPPLPP